MLYTMFKNLANNFLLIVTILLLLIYNTSYGTNNSFIKDTIIYEQFSIFASSGANGNIVPSGEIIVISGSNQTFQMVPDTGYHIFEVFVDDTLIGNVDSYTFYNVNKDHTIHVDFAIDTLTITASAGPNGSIVPSGAVKVLYGSNQTFTFTPNSGYHIDSVIVDGVFVGRDSSYTFNNVTTNRTIFVKFKLTEFIITATASAGGTISPSGSVPVAYGANQTFNFTPNTGYHILSVIVNGSSIGNPSSYTFTNVSSNHTIHVNFAIDTLTITASAGPNGSISPSGAVKVLYGSNQTFTFTPNTGYHIDSVFVDGVFVGRDSSYTFNNVTTNHTISVKFKLTEFIITATASAGGTISPSGSVPVAYGANQTFNFTPNTGYHILSVIVNGSSIGNPSSYTFTNVTSNHTIHVNFAIDTLTITASAGPNGSISPSGAVKVLYGSNQTFTFTPNTGYHIDSVFVDGVFVGRDSSYTFNNVTTNHTISVKFKLTEFIITATASAGGTISPSGSVPVAYGANQTFNFTPNTGYHILSVIVNGSSIGNPSSYTFTNVTSNHTIHVNFAIDTLTITASAGPNGSISPSGAVKVLYGSNQTFTFTPNTGYHIDSVFVDGVFVGRDSSYTFNNVTTNHTISVKFKLTEFIITATASAGGTISPSGSVPVAYGANQTFNFTPNTGYHILSVIVNGSSIGNPSSYTFTNVTSNHTIHVNFAIDTLTITASAGPNGSISPSGAVKVLYGSNQTFTFTPNTGYHIDSVFVDGVFVGRDSSYTFNNVTTNHTISVKFKLTEFIITATASAGGTISPSGSVPVAYGANQTFNFTPNTGYHILSVIVNGSSIGNPSSYTFTNVTSNHTIHVNFAIDTLTITASAGPNGSISPSGAVKVLYGSNQTFTFTPNTGYHIDSVFVDGVFVGRDSSYTFNNVTTNHTISVKFKLTEFIITATASAGGTISPSGSVPVAYGANQTFNFTPNTGYHILSVIVNGSSIGNPSSYTFTNVSSNHTIHVNFAIDTLTITASAGPNGSISPSGAVKVLYGSNQTFTFTPNTGYHIDSVFVDGVFVGRDSSYTFNNVTTNHTISVKFKLTEFIITATASAGGTISPSGSVPVAYGANQTFNFTPNTGYHILSVIVNGSSIGNPSSYTFTNVTSNHTIHVNFAIDTLTITASAGPNGSISPSGAVKVLYGSNQTFTFTPNTGYHIDSVFVDGVFVGRDSSYTFNNVTTNHTISVKFKLTEFIITATASAGGTISPSGSVPVAYGANQTFNFTPNTGYHILSVIVNGSSIGNPSSYTFTNVTSNHTIHVNFAIDTLTITASAGPNGSISPSGAVKVLYGSNQTFTFTPNTGYHIDSVFVDGVFVGRDSSYTFNNVTTNRTIFVKFKLTEFIITATASAGGTISPSGSVPVAYGANQTFNFTPNTGYHILSVIVNGSSIGNPSSYTFTNVTSNHTIHVNFAIDTLTITASAGPNGSISPSGAVKVLYGSNQTFTFTPNTGYHIDSVFVDGVFVGRDSSYTFNNVTTNHTISVKFKLTEFIITATASAGGTISPSGSVPVAYGANQTFNFTPNTGYHILSVIVNGSSIGNPSSYTFTNVTSNHTIHVNFAIDTLTITASAGPNGSISPSGAVKVLYGSNQTFTFTPNTGYHIDSVFVDGVFVGRDSSYTFNNVTTNRTIFVKFKLTEFIITATASAGGTISPSGSVPVAYDANQTFNFTPNTGYHILSVIVNGSSIGNPSSYTFTNVSSNHTIHVNFAIDTLTITASAGPNGSISPSGAVRVLYGSNQTFTFTPNTGYHIDSVFVDGVFVGRDSSYTFNNVTTNHTISVKFKLTEFIITATASAGGTISPSGSVPVAYGANQTFNFTPNTGYHILSVIVNGSSIGNPSSYTFTNVTSNHTIHVNFAIDTLTITASAGPNGSISPSGAVRVLYGSNQTFTFTPNTGYHIDSVFVDGVFVGRDSSYTFNNVTTNRTISVKFRIIRYTITATAGPNGAIVPSGNVSVNYGANQTFVFRPNTGYHVDSVFVNGSFVGKDTSYTFTNVTTNHTIFVKFAPNTITVTIRTNPDSLRFIVDGVIYNSTQTFTWIAGESHIISTDSIQSGLTDTRYVWSSWTNAGSMTSVVAPLVNTTYTANFTTQYYLTMQANPGGSVTPASGWYNRAQQVTITAIPDNKYYFTAWSGTGNGSYSGSNNPATVTINSPIRQIANFARNPVQITIGTNVPGLIFHYDGVPYTTTQTRTVAAGSQHSLGAPSPQTVDSVTRYVWQRWSNGGAQYHNIFPNEDTTYIAYFTKQFYLTMQATSGGSVSPSSGWQDSAAVVYIKATPNTGYAFRGWTGTGIGSYTGLLDSTSINIHSPITQLATFTLDTMIISATAGPNGSIFPSGNVKVPYNGSQTFTITPDSTYYISDVVVNGISVGPRTSYTFTNVRSNQSIIASFTRTGYTITATSGPNGTIIPSGAIPVEHGANQTFVFRPNTGYVVDSVFVDGVFTGNDTTYTFYNVTRNHTISVKFRIIRYTITATAGPNGAIVPSGDVSVNYGANQTFVFRPNTGYHVDSVFVNGLFVGSDTSYTFTNVTSNHTIFVKFAPNTITVTIRTNPDSLRFIVDGVIYNSTQTFTWIAGESHIISTDSIQSGPTDTRYVWSSWTNAGSMTSVVAPLVNTTYTANFTTQYYLTMQANPGGSVTPASGWYNRAQQVTITAIPDNKYYFTAWSGAGNGSYSGSNNPATVTINSPIRQIANFARNPVQITIGTNVPGLIFHYDGVPYTTTQTRTVAAGSQHSLGAPSPQTVDSVTRYVWQRWSNGGAQYHNIFPNEDTTYIAYFTKQFYLTMQATSGGSVSPSSGWQDSAAVVYIKATPNTGYAFRGWTGTGIGSYTGLLDSTSINILSPITQLATFTLDTMIISAIAGPNGSIFPSGNVKVPYNGSQTFTITPDSTYYISDVVVNGISVGPRTSYTFTNVRSNQSIIASFTRTGYTITATSGPNGTIIPSGAIPVEHGANQTFVFRPNTGYVVDSVFVNGAFIGSDTSYTFYNVTRNHTISVKFRIIRYTITATAGPNGAIVPSGNVSVNYGANQTFVFRPNTGYHVDSVFVNGSFVGKDTSYTFTNVTTNHTIFVKFAPNTITVTIRTNPDSLRFIVDGVIYNSTQTFTWIAGESHIISTDSIQSGLTDTRYVWSSWTNAGSMTSVVAPLVNTTYTANFTTQYYLTMQANPGGSVTPASGWYNRAQQVTITAIPDNKYYFTAWSGTGNGSYSGSANPVTVTMNSPIRQIANFTRNPILITISTEPDGRSFIFNGQIFSSIQTRSVEPGSQHTISVQSPQPDINPDKQYIWWKWSDGGAQTHNIYPVTDSNFIAYFKTQFAITINSSNPTAGSVEPSGRRFYTEGDTIIVSARANKGYIFTGWTGAINSTSNPIAILVDSAKNISANFAEAVEVTFRTQPESLLVIVDEINYRTPVKFNWLKGSSHNISTISPQFDGTGKIKYNWLLWSDSGTISHNITFSRDTTIIGYFSTEYYLSTIADQGGSVDRESGWYIKDTSITIYATADSGYLFNEWIGTGEGSYSGTNNPINIIMKGPITQKATFSKILPPPTLTGIPNGASNISTNPNLSWNPYPGATYYIVQVSTDSTFTDTSKIIFIAQITDTTIRINNLANLKTYYWRVRARAGNDITVFSEIRKFTTINANISVQSPLMNWATGYKYKINWTAENLSGKVNIILLTDSARNKIILKENVDNTGSFDYIVPDTILRGRIRVDYCKIKIESYLNNIVYGESGNFSIVSGTLPLRVRLSTIIQYPQESLSSRDYRLVSLPGIVDTLRIGNFISGKQKYDWRFFTDNGNTENFLDELSPNAYLKTGQGYWLVKNGNLLIPDFEMIMPKLDSSATFEISLNPGWNIIANPFDKIITWESILHTNNISFSTPLYSFDGSYKISLTLEPFKGYYFFNTNNLSKLNIPYPFGWLGKQQKVLVDILWNLQIILETDDNADSINYIGISRDASFGIDNYDYHKPPMFKDQSYIYLERNDADPKYNKFATDFRPELGEGQKWNLTISKPGNNTGMLTFNNIENIPPEYDVILINPENTIPYNLKQNNIVTINSSANFTKYELLIGKSSFINKELSKLTPDKFEISQNYPNPFNNTTTIRLKIPMDALVEIEIFNLIGQKVYTLLQSQLSKGTYSLTWDGIDNNKNILPSGIYFYRVKMNGEVKETKKLTIIK